MLIYLQMIESEEGQSKFKAIYEKYKGLMFYVANDILHNEHDAEDAVHQAFLSVLKNLSKIFEIDCPKTRSFIVNMVEWRAIDLLRSRTRVESVEYNDEITGRSIPLPGDHGLADAMASLPPQYRQVLLLRYDNGYSTCEIGKMLGKSQAAVQKMTERAKRELRILLEKEGVEI